MKKQYSDAIASFVVDILVIILLPIFIIHWLGVLISFIQMHVNDLDHRMKNRGSSK